LETVSNIGVDSEAGRIVPLERTPPTG
jgi:hypothetical protein